MAKLDGWLPPKTVRINAGAGGDLTNYQMLFMVYAGNGIDGVMYLPSGELVGKVYANNLCKAGFEDVRFSHHDNRTPYVQKIVEKVNGSHALVVVKVVESLAQNQLIDFHFGNPDAIDVSSDDVFSAAPISGVVGAWPLDEADAEVNPIEIDTGLASFWSTFYEGEASNKPAISMSDGVGITLTESNKTYSRIYHLYDANQDWSAKNKIRLKFTGASSGKAVSLILSDRDDETGYHGANTASYIFVDTSTTERWLDIPFSNFSLSGAMTWASVRKVVFNFDNCTAFNGTFIINSLLADVGVPAIDYSGNGNHGAATGTTIVPHPLYPNKTARQFNGIRDGIICPNVTLGTDITVIHIVKVLSTSDSLWTKSLRSSGGDIGSGQSSLSASAGWAIALRFTYGDGNSVSRQYNVGLSVGRTLFFAIGYKNGDDKITGGVNGVFGPIDTSVAGLTPTWNGTKTLYFGRSSGGEYGNVVLLGTYFFNRLLSQAEVQAIYSGYPDPYLEPGKIMVRKWATIALPVVGEWFDATAAEQLGRPVRKRRDPLDDWERRPSFWSLSKLRDSLREIVKS